MITANEAREMTKVRDEKNLAQAQQAAQEWCDNFVTTCIKSAIDNEEPPRIDLCACDLDRAGCAFAAQILTKAGYEVRRSGDQFFTIAW